MNWVISHLSQIWIVPFLDESNAEDQQGLAQMSMLLLKRCRMVVVCGNEVTENMNTEISTADRLHIICTTLEGLIQIKETKINDRGGKENEGLLVRLVLASQH